MYLKQLDPHSSGCDAHKERHVLAIITNQGITDSFSRLILFWAICLLLVNCLSLSTRMQALGGQSFLSILFNVLSSDKNNNKQTRSGIMSIAQTCQMISITQRAYQKYGLPGPIPRPIEPQSPGETWMTTSDNLWSSKLVNKNMYANYFSFFVPT